MSQESELEARVRKACETAEYAPAATLIVERYGAEIMAFLVSRLRSRSDADEVFAMFAEKLWVGLPGFEWRCTVRSWAYRLARNAANDFAAAAPNRPERNLALSQHASAPQLLERIRTTTAAYRLTGTKDRMRALREQLPSDDQMLLILRIDRGMDWRELATALGDGDSPLDDAQLEREAVRLRKKFERAKARLRELARADGLL
jgi:RNA polymerase sigma-70 factor, ECF subfamily